MLPYKDLFTHPDSALIVHLSSWAIFVSGFLEKGTSMSDQTDVLPSLGIFKIVEETFRTYFKNIWLFFLVAFVPMLLSAFGSNMQMRAILQNTTFDATDPTAIFGPGFYIAQLLVLILTVLLSAVLTTMAADTIRGQKTPLQIHISKAIRALPALIILGIVAYLVFAVGFVLLIVPGLVVLGMWSVTYPVILLEDAGFRALGRSATLTKEYRWPIIGGFLLMGIAMFILTLVQMALLGVSQFSADPSVALTTSPFQTIVSSVLTSISFGILCVFIVHVYIRLKEIKEGPDTSLADVFS